MQLASRSLHSRLDELALEALGPLALDFGSPQLPVARVPEYASIEIVFDDEPDFDELAATGTFVRFSAPYERVEIAEVPSLAEFRVRPARPTTFARTISASEVARRAVTAQMSTAAAELAAAIAQSSNAAANATVPFERVWYDEREETLAAIEDAPVEPKTSWWWLAISLAVGGVAVASLAML